MYCKLSKVYQDSQLATAISFGLCRVLVEVSVLWLQFPHILVLWLRIVDAHLSQDLLQIRLEGKQQLKYTYVHLDTTDSALRAKLK